MPSKNQADSVEDLVRQYLTEIGNYKLLTGEEEVRLAQAIDAGRQAVKTLDDGGSSIRSARRLQLEAAIAQGRDATQRFVQANLRLVVSIAKRYQRSGVPLLDLVQEGNLGLMRAVDKFDHRKGFKFSTYATWWIRQAISRAIADKGRTIRVPVHMVEATTQVTQAVTRLTRALGRAPTVDELAQETGLSTEKIATALSIGPEPVSLFQNVGDDNAELVDFLADESAQAPFEAAAEEMDRAELRAALASLTIREQRVLELRFGLSDDESHTLEEVGQEFNVSRERARQIEAKALSKLRHPCTPALPSRLVAY